MAESAQQGAGRVAAIWRYPVKSMRGEALDEIHVEERGLLGDRAYALRDEETGRLASAKNPRRWPNLVELRAAYAEAPRPGSPLPPAGITLPEGELVSTAAPDAEARLSAAVGRRVHIARPEATPARAEGYWPEHEWLPRRGEVYEYELAPGLFFDGSFVHLLATGTLERLASRAPGSRFEVPRFRPNFVIEARGGPDGFPERAWIGRTLAIGEALLRVDRPCPRCVITTLAQGELPKDAGVLRAAVEANGGAVGVYASVLRPGLVRCGDEARLG